ncbi:sigma-70 family RNA polymerase sigma factor [Cupriavidus gilardii]|jgi:hypothetical protein|uniref:Sigma-70 family RNA polymerase sigma factor n=1 Tax=Cupriavidus gilardii TaxID=82541 RepID=A0ABY4VXD6_9BURK|nr:sigma-70 family RNA polymerase sigma factor [Cupriavidus gilardii]MCT9074243.1 sigma-70 family RNA polymerase sigma factor [Cupriavidus gilardii]QKS60668.1 sigma-70 family RNA polymerase sigma factor [Cupriavidus gilardii]USE80496.1 hypothetical protein NDR89_12025 [Cupriavidus gilardii]UXC36368.1 sigma-70 family RNA polymerase sigma factor [Cupriavidus gilardii]
MFSDLAGAFLAKLIPAILPDLARIAKQSRGEMTVDDLQGEAWILAEKLSRNRDPRPDPADRAFQQQILARLFNRFVKFADKRLRFAVRLDEQIEDDNGGTHENWFAATLTAPEANEPYRMLETYEQLNQQDKTVLARFAEAVAYLRVFANMPNDLTSIANHLAISTGTLRKRLKYAERTMALQPSLFDGVTQIEENFMPPAAGRKHRIVPAVDSACSMAVQCRLFPRAYVPLRLICLQQGR